MIEERFRLNEFEFGLVREKDRVVLVRLSAIDSIVLKGSGELVLRVGPDLFFCDLGSVDPVILDLLFRFGLVSAEGSGGSGDGSKGSEGSGDGSGGDGSSGGGGD